MRLTSLIHCAGLGLLLMSMAWALKETKAFDSSFIKFLDQNNYSGGAVAALKDGKLLVARGYGTDQSGKGFTPNSKFHVSSVAKSLTGVAVMQMVERGKISLQDKVFGVDGILKSIQPWRESSLDLRLYDITVEHLLHHRAGWDITTPLYDPLLNEFYQKKYETVPNIAADMGLTLPLKPREIISYVMSYPLSFAPGTNTAYTNIAYLVLGRVVEAVSVMDYKDYVKKHILDPCGMWNTGLAARHKHDLSVSRDEQPSLADSLDPISVDSALGWHSNVYDLMRFIRCSFETGELLSEKYKKLLVGRPDSAITQLNSSWYSSGFRADTAGHVWQEADPQADDLVMYHNLRLRNSSQTSGLPDSWVVLLHGKGNTNVEQFTRNLMAVLETRVPTENLFLDDLSDLHNHQKWEPPKGYDSSPEYAIKYKVNEHHLQAYVHAIRDEGFNVVWLTSYTVHHNTFFLLISTRITQPTRQQYDYIFEHGMDHRQLLKRKLQLEEAGYNMTQLHSYKSQAHNNPISFAAIFRQDAFSADIQMKYGTGHLPEPYEKLVQMYYEKQFYPVSQTVVYEHEEEQFSFIFIKDSAIERTDFKHYYDMSVNRLAKLTAENAKLNLHLSYLNSYDISGKVRLAAIYTNATSSVGVLEIDQTQTLATETTIANLNRGLNPKFMVPTIGDDKLLKFVVYYENE